MRFLIASSNNVIHYASEAYECFEPVLGIGDFFPSAPAVAWSLINAPYGVKINMHGVITVAVDAVLNIVNEITVRAVYRETEYAATLRLSKVLVRVLFESSHVPINGLVSTSPLLQDSRIKRRDRANTSFFMSNPGFLHIHQGL